MENIKRAREPRSTQAKVAVLIEFNYALSIGLMLAIFSPMNSLPLRKFLFQILGSEARGDRLVMQDDGNLVIYNTKTSAVVWESGTAEDGGPNRTILR